MKEKTDRDTRKNPLVYLFSKTWRYSSNRKQVVLFWSMFIIANIITLVCYPLALAQIVNTIQQQGITRDNIKVLLGLLFIIPGVNTIFWCFHGPARVKERDNAFTARASYRKYLQWGVLTYPMQWHADHHSGDTIDKVEKGTTALYAFSSESFLVLKTSVTLIVSYGMLAYFSWPSAIIVVVMIAFTILITMWFDKRILGNYKILNRAENQISAGIYDMIGNITTIVILRIEKLVFRDISKMIDDPFPLYHKNSIQIEVKWFLVSSCCSLMMTAVLAAYFWQKLGMPQGILIGNAFLLMQYLEKVSDVFFEFTSMYGDIISRKSKVMNSEELATDFRQENLQNHLLPKHWQRIEINNLNFSYHNEEGRDLHLSDLQFSIHRRQRIALVGESGGGKTTFFKMIVGLYDPASVTVTVDGIHLPNGFQGISRDIALVPQAPEIFAATIRKNITMGAEASDEEIRHFTDMACLSGVIHALPKGLESAINEKGVNLSVGQQQRLALARGLFVCKDKSIILLDEPTSSLDSANELAVYQNVFREFRNTSIISSIHRLHLLPLFDRIYVFDKGKIIDSGTLDQLQKTCPKFIQMWANYQHRKDDIGQD